MTAACAHLFVVSLRRQFFSRQTLISGVLTILCTLIVVGWRMQEEPSVRKFAEGVVVLVHSAFLLPIFAICYGTSGIGAEREDRTLVYLLITPLPRPLVYLAKFAAATLLVLAWTSVSLAMMCWVARPWGEEAMRLFWPSLLLGGVAYASLFHTLGAAFRRGTIISLAYAFFLEGLLGAMPGIVKRVAVSFYVSCMIYDAGADHGVGPIVAPEMFLPVRGGTAAIVLLALAAGLCAIGLVVFTRREYRDLS
jgi:ABC-type transport system involved in multi-copper enzyme maturation permease subunit